MSNAAFISATRILLVCPCGNAALNRAAKAILVFLQKEHQIQQWKGLTFSSFVPPVFTGLFWDEEEERAKEKWKTDYNLLVTIDAPELLPSDLFDYLTRLYGRLNTFYANEGLPQKKLWITVHPLAILEVAERKRPK